jgi:hypothetical protein
VIKNRKPIVWLEPVRGDYETRLTLRYRRNWQKMSAEDRRDALLAMAGELEVIVQQMRDEAEVWQ